MVVTDTVVCPPMRPVISQRHACCVFRISHMSIGRGQATQLPLEHTKCNGMYTIPLLGRGSFDSHSMPSVNGPEGGLRRILPMKDLKAFSQLSISLGMGDMHGTCSNQPVKALYVVCNNCDMRAACCHAFSIYTSMPCPFARGAHI